MSALSERISAMEEKMIMTQERLIPDWSDKMRTAADELEAKRAELEAYKVEAADKEKEAREKLESMTRKKEDADFENKSLSEDLAEKAAAEEVLEETCVDKDIELRPDGKEKKGEAKAALIKVLEKHEADFKAIIVGQEANLEGLGKEMVVIKAAIEKSKKVVEASSKGEYYKLG